jgi:ribosomal protein S1
MKSYAATFLGIATLFAVPLPAYANTGAAAKAQEVRDYLTQKYPAATHQAVNVHGITDFRQFIQNVEAKYGPVTMTSMSSSKPGDWARWLLKAGADTKCVEISANQPNRSEPKVFVTVAANLPCDSARYKSLGLSPR